LQQWTRQPKTAQALALRARIVLACAEGANNKDVAATLGVWPQTVTKWRARFVADRLDGLADERRPGAPRKITDEQVEAVIVKTLQEAPPNGDTHWSTRSMAKAVGLNQTAISRIWRAFGLQPHLVDAWTLSADPHFIDKVRNVGLYLEPPDKAIVLAVDEKAQAQTLDRTVLMPPKTSGVQGRKTHDYVHHATTSLLTALDVPADKAINRQQLRHRHQKFLRFLKAIDANTPQELDLHVVCHNDTTHKAPAIKAWLAAHPHFHLHVTPTSGSWHTVVERWFAELTNRKGLSPYSPQHQQPEADVNAWIEIRNPDRKFFL
jgi:transposase